MALRPTGRSKPTSAPPPLPNSVNGAALLSRILRDTNVSPSPTAFVVPPACAAPRLSPFVCYNRAQCPLFSPPQSPWVLRYVFLAGQHRPRGQDRGRGHVHYAVVPPPDLPPSHLYGA